LIGRRSFLLEKNHQRERSLPRRKEELELFFWAAHEAIKLVVSVALAVYLIVSLVTGENLISFWLPP
jgi:hypothetical protein